MIDRVLIIVRDGQGDWEVYRDARVLSVTEDGSAMKVKAKWWLPAQWMPVNGLACQLLPLKA